MSLIDIGANLTHDSFDHDLSLVMDAARANAVSQIIVTGASLEGSVKALELARAFPGFLFATAGIHPHHADEVTDAVMAEIESLLQATEVRAVGETGLDYFRDLSPRPDQLRVFEQHLELAVTTGLPMFLHERDAAEAFTPLLRQYRSRLSDVVVHCFTGEASALHGYLDLDCHIGITGWICDERRGKHLGDLVGEIPANRLMIETDAPYLLPRTLRPKPKAHRNEPKHLLHICEHVARCRAESTAETMQITRENAQRFFRL